MIEFLTRYYQRIKTTAGNLLRHIKGTIVETLRIRKEED